MKKQVYEIDDNGFIKEIYVANVDEKGNILDENMTLFISVDPPDGLYKAKWIGNQWIEGATQEEIDDLDQEKSPLPLSTAERLKVLEDTVNFLLGL